MFIPPMYAVDDYEFAVVAIVHFACEYREVNGKEGECLDASVGHAAEETSGHTPTAHVIVYQTHLNAPLCRIDERVGNEVSYGVVLNDVSVNVYMMLCLAYII